MFVPLIAGSGGRQQCKSDAIAILQSVAIFLRNTVSPLDSARYQRDPPLSCHPSPRWL
jgi:hypothetical protein